MSREYCPDCGIECAYHGSGMNDKYKAAMSWKHEQEEREQHERWVREGIIEEND